MVVTSAEVDGPAVVEGELGTHDGTCGGVAHGGKETPLKEEVGEVAEGGDFGDAGDGLGLLEAGEVGAAVDAKEEFVGGAVGCIMVLAVEETSGAEVLEDFAVFGGVEGVEPLYAEKGDVVAG